VFPLLRHLVVVVFIIALLNIALLKVNMWNSDIKQLLMFFGSCSQEFDYLFASKSSFKTLLLKQKKMLPFHR